MAMQHFSIIHFKQSEERIFKQYLKFYHYLFARSKLLTGIQTEEQFVRLHCGLFMPAHLCAHSLTGCEGGDRRATTSAPGT